MVSAVFSGFCVWCFGFADGNFMVGSGICDFDFRGFRSGFVGFNGEGIIPLGGKIDLRRSGFRCCGRACDLR